MNRREFLQSLAAIGAAVSLPIEAIGSAPDNVLEQAWQQVSQQPMTFYVNEYGALSIDAVETYATTRRELLDYQEVTTREELIDFAQETRAGDLLECELSDPSWFDDEASIPDNCEDWVSSADDPTISLLIARVNDWMNESPDGRDYEVADLQGHTGRGFALQFFRDSFEDVDMFDIVVVEGDCPGSSYFAAELRMDVDTANELAVEYGIPIRFAEQG